MTRCPKCKTRFVRLAPRWGLAECLVGWLTVYPHRCQLCAHRFLAFCGRLSDSPQRNFQRVRVNFRTWIRSAFFQPHFPAIPGNIVNLSVGGCRLDGEMPIPEGARLRLVFEVGEHEKPVTIEEAVVCSHSGKGLGLSFTKVRREEKRRIGRIVQGALANPRAMAAASAPASSSRGINVRP